MMSIHVISPLDGSLAEMSLQIHQGGGGPPIMIAMACIVVLSSWAQYASRVSSKLKSIEQSDRCHSWVTGQARRLKWAVFGVIGLAVPIYETCHVLGLN